MDIYENGENAYNMTTQLPDKSKSSKNRKQRQKAKKGAKENKPEEYDEESIAGLRIKMENARAENDNELVNNLRQKIWLLQDIAASVKSKVSTEKLSSILKESNKVVKKEAAQVVILDAPPLPNQSLDKIQEDVLKKKLRKLQKKKDDITKLRERKNQGEKLELTQLAKIEKEKLLDDQIDDVEEDMFQLKRRSK